MKPMKRIGVIALLLSGFAVSVLAKVPSLMNFQGRLLDELGNPVSSNVTVNVDVYTNATLGAAVYKESLGTVPVNNGIYSVSFGSSPSFGELGEALSNAEAWLEVTIDGTPLSPRQQLMSVPYARSAAALGSVLADDPTLPAPVAGTIRWTGSDFEGFNGTDWVLLSPPRSRPLVEPDMVTVGNVGNADDPNSNGLGGNSGAVSYTYKIGKFEVSNAEYTEFLNAVDPSGVNALALYNANMNISAAEGGKYVVKLGFADKPVLFVSFYDAMRFCNWLHNAAVDGGDTENGAYTLLGGTASPSNGMTVQRNAEAKFVVPTQDEWYKAAYHQPSELGGDTDNYWLYPTKSNSPPDASSPPGTAPAANYNDVVGSVTDVGAYTTTVGFYGTFDMAGNVWEWIETIDDGGSSRVLRGGAWILFDQFLGSDGPVTNTPVFENFNVGFRVSSP